MIICAEDMSAMNFSLFIIDSQKFKANLKLQLEM
jgi:hypothetical protein